MKKLHELNEKELAKIIVAHGKMIIKEKDQEKQLVELKYISDLIQEYLK